MTQITRHRTQTALIGNEAILEFGFTFQWRESGGKNRENNRNGILPVRRSGHDARPSRSFGKPLRERTHWLTPKPCSYKEICMSYRAPPEKLQLPAPKDVLFMV